MGRCCEASLRVYAPKIIPIQSIIITGTPYRPSGPYGSVVVPYNDGTVIQIGVWNGTTWSIFGTEPIGSIVNYSMALTPPSTISPVFTTTNGTLTDAWTSSAVMSELMSRNFTIAGTLVGGTYQLSLYEYVSGSLINTLATVVLDGPVQAMDFRCDHVVVATSLSLSLYRFCRTTSTLLLRFKNTYSMPINTVRLLGRKKVYVLATVTAYVPPGTIQTFFPSTTLTTNVPPGNWFILTSCGNVLNARYIPSGIQDFTYDAYQDLVVFNENSTQITMSLTVDRSVMIEDILDSATVTSGYRWDLVGGERIAQVVAYAPNSILIYQVCMD